MTEFSEPALPDSARSGQVQTDAYQLTDAYTRASKSFRAVLSVALRRHGLHFGQHLVLAALDDRDGQTPGEIAAAVSVTTPTIVKMASRMEVAGLLIRRPDTVDRRLVRLYLTEVGRDLSGPLASELQAVEHRLVRGLTQAEQAQLLTLMNRVSDNAAALLREWNEKPPE